MNITMISHFNCVRALKISAALKNAGHTVNMISNTNRSTGIFDSYMLYGNVWQLESNIRMAADSTDIFHIHNEPSFPATIVRRVIPDAKVVLDLHDMNGWMLETNEKIWFEEDIAIMSSDALVYPSEIAETETNKRMDYKGKTIHLPPAALMSSYKYMSWDSSKDIVNQAGHSLPTEHHRSFRDYTKLYGDLIKNKKRVDAFCPSKEKEMLDYYARIGVEIRTMPYEDLLLEIGKYCWNVVGNVDGHVVWKYAVPNKFYDALAAGSPVVNFSCPEIGKIIDKYGVGINVSSVEELVERWDEHMQCRYNVMMHREKLSMENEIHKLEELYASLHSST